MINNTGIRIAAEDGRHAVYYDRQCMSLHYNRKGARQAARALHVTMWPDDSPEQLDRWYGHDSRP